jgi:hypothetical protein
MASYVEAWFHTDAPNVKGRLWIDEVTRSGNSVSYRFNVSAYSTSSGAWWNDPWFIDAWVNGTQKKDNAMLKPGTSGKIGSTEYWLTSNNSHITGSTSVGTPKATTIPVRVVPLYTWNYWGMGTDVTWNVSVPSAEGTITAPTISCGIRDIGVDRATIYGAITNNPSSWWRIHLYDTGGAWQTYTTGSEVSYTKTGLAHNTTYNMYYQTTNYADGEGSGLIAKSFTTSGNAPTATGLPISNVTRTSASVSINGTYDTNASWGGWEVQYGTTTNYGTAGGSTLSNLTPNTTYYVRGRFYDNWGRWSGWVTNSFKTTGNNPSISSHGLKTGGQTSVTMQYSASYDTNDSLSSYKWEYGTSTSYGKSVSNTNSITGLSANTTYYYRLTVTGTQGRSSTATGSFTTDYATQQITNMTIEGVTETSTIVKVTVPNPSWLTKLVCWLYEADGTTLVTSQTKTSGITATNTFSFEGLNPGTVYIAKAQITTNGRNTTYNSGIASIELQTLDDSVITMIKADGTTEKYKMYVMGAGNIYDGHRLSWKNGYYAVGTEGANISTVFTDATMSACVTSPITILPNIAYTITNSEDGVNFIIHGTDNAGNITHTGYTVAPGNKYTFTGNSSTTKLWISITSTTEPISTATAKYFQFNIFRTVEKTLIQKEQVVILNGKIRYIDIMSSGSTANNPTHIVELKVFNQDGENIALGKPVSIIKGIPEADAYGNTARVTDGDTTTSNYLGITPKSSLDLQTIVRVDLGKEYTDIDHVTLWRYYGDGRTYHETRLFGRDANLQLTWKFHSFKIDGEYPETAEGRTFYIAREEVAHVPYIHGFRLEPEADTLDSTNILINAEAIVFMPEVINNLTSYRTDAILAANQGRLLKEDIGDLTALTTETQKSIVDAINEIWMDFNEISGYANTLDTILSAPLNK